ncbi:MAG: hypothetical protein KJ592_00380 [Nanoarchaeota archaeon]|nr:hypothetical protein [Nanoarchaeota archaeon]
MALKDIIQYGKVGVGSLLEIGTATYFIGRDIIEGHAFEGAISQLETITPETLEQAYKVAEQFGDKALPPAEFVIATGIAGGMLIVSGVYNLVKNYRSQKTE